MTRADLAQQPCPLGGTHRLTEPRTWIGASCFKCHKTWEGPTLEPTYPGDAQPVVPWEAKS